MTYRALCIAMAMGVILHIVSGQRLPYISHITEEQIKDIGDVVELNCTVQDVQDYPALWMKSSDRTSQIELQPLSTGPWLITHDSRFALKYDVASSTYTLKIKDIQEADAGLYVCQVLMSIVKKVTAEVELQVRKPPVIFDNSTRSIVAREGESVQMQCYSAGFPVPKVSWRREGNVMLPTGEYIYRDNILNITEISKEDGGTYCCVAENGVGKGARRNIDVEVEFAPVITVLKPRIGQALQYDADLGCHIEANPPPEISWYKDDIELSNNQHYSISNFAVADQVIESTIRVIAVEKKQFGQYICQAANKHGLAEADVQLFERVMPDIDFLGLLFDSYYSPAQRNTPILLIQTIPLWLITFSTV